MVASFAHHGPAPHHGIATPDETPGRADACPSPAPSSCEAMPQRDYGHHGDEVVYATDLDEYGAETLEYMKEMEVSVLLDRTGDHSCRPGGQTWALGM